MVTAFAVEMANIYGAKTTISRGRVHDYLGMDLDFRTCPGKLIIFMIKYLQKIIDDFPEVLRGTKSCPASDNLFKTRDNEDRELLPEEMARKFHRTTAQKKNLCKRARPDVKTLVSFLATRVKEPGVDDWGGLRRGLMYLKGTLYMKRYLTADSLINIFWWVDGFLGYTGTQGEHRRHEVNGKGCYCEYFEKTQGDP